MDLVIWEPTDWRSSLTSLLIVILVARQWHSQQGLHLVLRLILEAARPWAVHHRVMEADHQWAALQEASAVVLHQAMALVHLEALAMDATDGLVGIAASTQAA